eukprot:5200493-Pyramimonas_sp.AAC.1
MKDCTFPDSKEARRGDPECYSRWWARAWTQRAINHAETRRLRKSQCMDMRMFLSLHEGHFNLARRR